MILGNYYRLLNTLNERAKEWGIAELRDCFRTCSNVGSSDTHAPLHVFHRDMFKKKRKLLPDLLLHPSESTSE